MIYLDKNNNNNNFITSYKNITKLKKTLHVNTLLCTELKPLYKTIISDLSTNYIQINSSNGRSMFKPFAIYRLG